MRSLRALRPFAHREYRVLIAALAKTAGEIIGYAGVKLPAAAARLQDIEIRKVQYAGRVG